MNYGKKSLIITVPLQKIPHKISLAEAFTLQLKFLFKHSSLFYNKGLEVYTATSNNPTQKENFPLLLTGKFHHQEA